MADFQSMEPRYLKKGNGVGTVHGVGFHFQTINTELLINVPFLQIYF